MKHKPLFVWGRFFLLIGIALALVLRDYQVEELIRWRPYLRSQVTCSISQTRPGEFFFIRVEPLQANQTIKVTAPFIAEAPRVFVHREGVVALIPLDYRTAPGTYIMEVAIMKSGAVIQKLEQNITVNHRDFATQKMYVSPELLGSRDERHWAEDRIFTSQARSQPTPKSLWEGSFLKPLEGRLTTQFGQIRYINEQESGRHSGLDIAAPKGTPVVASNHGIVTLARCLHVTGNTVILDHGLNLFTSYAHLDQINVQLGEQVTKGQIIGTVGNTGFSTGPHLHWAVSVGAVFVDPDLIMATESLKVD